MFCFSLAAQIVEDWERERRATRHPQLPRPFLIRNAQERRENEASGNKGGRGEQQHCPGLCSKGKFQWLRGSLVQYKASGRW